MGHRILRGETFCSGCSIQPAVGAHKRERRLSGSATQGLHGESGREMNGIIAAQAVALSHCHRDVYNTFGHIDELELAEKVNLELRDRDCRVGGRQRPGVEPEGEGGDHFRTRDADHVHLVRTLRR